MRDWIILKIISQIYLFYKKAQYDDVNQGRCGECGDEWKLQRPRPNEEGGQYGRGIIGKKYKAEEVSLLLQKYNSVFIAVI